MDRLLQAAALREVSAAAQLFNEATKLAGAAGTKGSSNPSTGDELLGKIEEISKIFWETKQA